MPKIKQIETLESLAIRKLVAHLCTIAEDLIPVMTRAIGTLNPHFTTYSESKRNDTDANSDDVNDSTDDDANERIVHVFDDGDDNNNKACEHHKDALSSRKASALLKLYMRTLRSILEYNVPCFLFDRLSDGLFHDIPKMIDRIKSRKSIRTSMGEFLGQVNVAVSLSEVIIGPYLTRCSFEEMPKALQQIFYNNLNCLIGVKYLNMGSLSGGWKTADIEGTILTGLLCMTNLRQVTINYDCTNNIILALIDTCPLLHTLDVSSSKSLTNDSVNLFIRMKQLRSVNLHRTSVGMEGYVKLLLGLPQLEDVGRYDDIGRCLEFIVDQYEPNLQPFALRKFASRYVTTRFLQILAEYCPKMQFVSIFYNALLCDLMSLLGINQLSNLHLLACDFFSDQVRDVLSVKGCNLTHLHLEHVDQIDMNALMYISQLCPDLKVFIIYNCELIESTSLYMKRPIIPPFMNLHHLTLVAQCDLYHLEFLLSTCLQIKTIKLGTLVPTTDSLFDRVLCRNPMEHLEELSIVCSDGLTIAMAYKLLEVCPKLTILNELEGWSRIEEFELDKFKAFININNFDINTESRRFKTSGSNDEVF